MGKYWYRDLINAGSESKITIPTECPACINLVSWDLRRYSPVQHSPARAWVLVVPMGMDQHYLVPLKKEVHVWGRRRTHQLCVFITGNGRNAFPNIEFFKWFTGVLASARMEREMVTVGGCCWNKCDEGVLPTSRLSDTSACSWTETALWSPGSISTPRACWEGNNSARFLLDLATKSETNLFLFWTWESGC